MVHGLLSIHIIFFSLLFLWVSYKLLVYSNGPLKTFTISNFFMLKYLIFAFIGSVLYNVVFFNLESNYGMYDDLGYVFNIWLYCSLGLVLVPLGMLIANLFFKLNFNQLNRNFFKTPLKFFKVNIGVQLSIILVLVISFFSLLIYRMKVGELPILNLFSGANEAALALMRSDAGNNFSGKLHWFKFLIGASSKFMLIILFFNKRRNFLWKSLFTICLFYVFFISVMNLNKAPIIDLLLLLFVSGVVQKKRINFKLIIGLAAVVFSILILMYVFFMGQSDKNLLVILKIIFHRVFVSQIAPFYWYHANDTTFNPNGEIGFFNYNFTMDSIGWINCDYFYNSTDPLTGVNVILPDDHNGSNTLIFIYYSDINSVANMHDYDNDSNFDLGSGYSTPVGMDITFVTISEIDSIFYYNLTNTTLTNNHVEEINSLTPVSEEDLQTIIDNLP